MLEPIEASIRESEQENQPEFAFGQAAAGPLDERDKT